MKAVSIPSLIAAMILCSSTLVFAQTANGTVGAAAGAAVQDGTVDLSLDTNADGTVDADETAAGVTAGGSVDLSLDTNGDGTVDDEEAATGEEPDMSLDTDGDGTVSAEEAAAGAANMTTTECSSVDFGTMVSADGIAAIQAATTAQIVRLADCDDEQSAMIDNEIELAVFGNQSIAAMLSAEGMGGGELRGVTVGSEGSVTVFVEDDEEGTASQ